MSNFLSTSQLKSFLISSINEGYTNMTADEILSTLLASINAMESEPIDKRTLYTSRDIQDIRNYLIDKIMELTDKWTDFNESDTGMVLVELMAGLGDMLGFYLDKSTLECYITSVKQRKNGVGMLSLINYKMRMTNSCVTTGRFILPKIYDQDVTIPRYTQVTAVLADKSEVKFATQYEVVIPAGTQQIDVPLIQGVVTRSYVKVSDLKNNQKIQLLANDIAAGSMIITINGEEWQEIPDVVIDDVPGPKYSLFETKECKPYVHFHNSYQKYLPSDESIKAEFLYLTSLGSKGRIKEGMISRVDSSIKAGNVDIATSVEVTNIEPSSGGSERETLDEARVQAPKTLAMLGKAIILEDYHDMAVGIPGVLKCSALDWSVENGRYVQQPYVVKLYIIPTDTVEPSTEQLTEIKAYFDDHRVPSSMTVEVYPANYNVVDVVARVYANVAAKNKESLRSRIESRIKDYFRPENMDFGKGIQPSNIITLIETTTEAIKYVELDSPTSSDENFDLTQFPSLGELSIEVILTNGK
ncbi:MAG: baseplate J/gp47 family protein [Lachnospiraceae bacterium]|nr:baseplate J/gp47 family protein [Lachnospiraceae bacterium]